MHRQHRLGVGSSLAGYWEGNGRLPIRHDFIMVGKSFDIPAILFFRIHTLHTQQQKQECVNQHFPSLSLAAQ
jgi:hypothetical protein